VLIPPPVTGLSTTAYCSSYLNGIQSTSHSKSIIAPLWLDTTYTAVADPEGPTLIPKVRNVTRYSANFIHSHYQNIQHRRHVKEWICTGGIRGIAPFILNLGASWGWVVNLAPRRLYPWGRTTVFIEQEDGCAAVPDRTFLHLFSSNLLSFVVITALTVFVTAAYADLIKVFSNFKWHLELG
jgi:hypothetical protein